MSTVTRERPATAPTAPASAIAAPSRPSPSATSARTLFRIQFQSAIRDEEAHRLRGALDMALHLHPKHPAVTPPLGVARLDFHSGLFLVRAT